MPLWSDEELAGLPRGRRRARAWTELRRREIHSLKGAGIRDWKGQRIALREEGGGGLPEFTDPAFPAIQLDLLYLLLADGQWVQILTHQDDIEWGLYARKVLSLPDLTGEGIYSSDDLHDVPRGQVRSVATRTSAVGNIDEIAFGIDGHYVILVAAEAPEGIDGSLTYHRGDESILLFPDRRDLENLEWAGGSR